MEMKVRKIVILLWILAVSATSFQGGCGSYSITSGKPIDEKTVKMIQPGKTTKDEIIQLFGPPQSIEKPSGKEEATAKEEKVKTMVVPAWPGGTIPPSFESSFELFSSKHKIIEDHRIYVYTFTKFKGEVGPFGGGSHNLSDKLLILINEKTGVVEDYVFSKETQ
jgi:hypothetical protein